MIDQEKDVTWIEEPVMGFWDSTLLPAVLSGLKTTLRHVVARKPVTRQYPEEKPDLPLHYRGVHRLNRDEQGRVKCVACMLCAWSYAKPTCRSIDPNEGCTGG